MVEEDDPNWEIVEDQSSTSSSSDNGASETLGETDTPGDTDTLCSSVDESETLGRKYVYCPVSNDSQESGDDYFTQNYKYLFQLVIHKFCIYMKTTFNYCFHTYMYI